MFLLALGMPADGEVNCCGNEITVEGRLSLVGNEPFVHTALITEEDERYVLKADKKVIDEMWRARTIIKVTGTCEEDRAYGISGRYIEVQSWEPLN